ncbi:hypothetical protein ABK040_014086 [Willaertia magna]
MNILRAIKKRKGESDEISTQDKSESSNSSSSSTTQGFFSFLFNTNNNNTQEEEQAIDMNDEEEEDDDLNTSINIVNGVSSIVHPKKRLTNSKFSQVRKQLNEFKKIQNEFNGKVSQNKENIQQLQRNEDIHVTQSPSFKQYQKQSLRYDNENKENANNTTIATSLARERMSDKRRTSNASNVSGLTNHISYGTPTPTKKKSLLASLFSFGSASLENQTTTGVNDLMLNSPNTLAMAYKKKDEELQRIKEQFKCPLYTLTPPKSPMIQSTSSLLALANGSFQSPQQARSSNRKSVSLNLTEGGGCEESLMDKKRKLSRYESENNNEFKFELDEEEKPMIRKDSKFANQTYYCYTFNLILLKGLNIKNSGHGFKEASNVYAIMELGQWRQTSKVKMNTRNPVWNQSFQFQFISPYNPEQPPHKQHIVDSSNSSKVLKIKLYDYDEIFEHMPLGELEVDIRHLVFQCIEDEGKKNESGRVFMKRSPTYKQSYPLEGVDPKFNSQLQIQYRLEFHFDKKNSVVYNFF